MRLAAQTKLGFYPAHPTAVEGICRCLYPDPDRASMATMIDPCAGDGLAALRIATHLGVPGHRVYAVELDAGRALKARENLPGAKVLGPASFLGSSITAGSLSLAYVNPPFDDELGGGRRVEFTFAEKATALLKHLGVLVLVLPYGAIRSNTEFQDYLDSYYQNARVYRFPADVRPYREVVYVGQRRRDQINARGTGYLRQRGLAYNEPHVEVGTEAGYSLVVPWSHAPGVFRKVDLTDAELAEGLARSPLRALFDPPPLLSVKQPPADLSVGHVSLVLAAGLLNGVIRPDDEPPHVVRGTARKVDYQSTPPTETEGATSDTRVIKEVWSQKIELVVRAVAADGEIVTFTEKKKETNNAVVPGGDS